jgi:hypothetical protein
VETTGIPRRRMLVPALAIVWVLTISGGGVLMWDFESTPGVPSSPPDVWPVASRIPHAANRPTLVMLVHPHCPCSRASLEELDRIMALVAGRVTAHVLVAHSGDVPQGRIRTRLWRRAANIRGVEVSSDDGTEAIRFQAFTSGQTLLYGTDGRLLFSGGITVARGHEGDSGGRRAIEGLLTDEVTTVRQTAVFGCSLLGSERNVESKAHHAL